MSEWVALALTVLVQGVGAAYVYGKLTERVTGHGKRIHTLELTSTDHEKRITRLEA